MAALRATGLSEVVHGIPICHQAGLQSALFEPVVWIAQPRALDSFRRKAPVNILASTRLYNLRSDDPERPWLEESFGRLETHHERVLGVLEAQQDLGHDLCISEAECAAHFSFTPLTPRLAFVSSPLLDSGDFYFKTTDPAGIFLT